MDHRISNNTTKTLALLFLTTWSADGLFASARKGSNTSTPKASIATKTKSPKTPRNTPKKTTPRKAIDSSDSWEEEVPVRKSAPKTPGKDIVAQANLADDGDRHAPVPAQHSDQEHDSSIAFHVDDGEGNVSIQGQPNSKICAFEIRGTGTIHQGEGGISIIGGEPTDFREEAVLPGGLGPNILVRDITIDANTPQAGTSNSNSRRSPSVPQKYPHEHDPLMICRMEDKFIDLTPRECRISSQFDARLYAFEIQGEGKTLQNEQSLRSQLLALSRLLIDQPPELEALSEITENERTEIRTRLRDEQKAHSYTSERSVPISLRALSSLAGCPVLYLELGNKFPHQDMVVRRIYINAENNDEFSEEVFSRYTGRGSDAYMLNKIENDPRIAIIINNIHKKRLVFSLPYLPANTIYQLPTSSNSELRKRISRETWIRWGKNTVAGTVATSIILGGCQSTYQHYKDPLSKGLQATGGFFSRAWERVKSFFHKDPEPVK
ncbi:MAG: hypothetical protein K2L24_03310 [Opitutales bacterium]|nr:hypothetical protein [Opitutales bacterium]